MKYRREIDGLRAVAVLPVILFHAGFKAFEGGFVGVDVFFVISGYLITTIILSDMNKEKFSIVTFYERRARRILPALLFVMFCCLPFAWLWLLPSYLKDFSESLIAISLFSSNILFWRESGYFATSSELNPLLHTWSLAVEEQYYVLFPLFLMALWKFRKRWIFGSLIAVGAISLCVAQWGAYRHPNPTFYLLPTRGWELAIGALIAFYFLYKQEHAEFIKSHSKTSEFFGCVGLLLIFYSILVFDKSTPFPSLYALVPTVGTGLIIIFSTSKTVVGRFLGFKLMVGIGLLSYSTYLWHLPLFVFARHRSLAEPSTSFLLTLSVLSIALAYLSWRYVEMPFRDKKVFGRKAVFGFAVVGSLIFISLGVAGSIADGFIHRYDQKTHALLKVEEVSGYVPIRAFSLEDKDFIDDGRSKVVLIGDSLAQDLVNVIYENRYNEKLDMTYHFIPPGCGNLYLDEDFSCHISPRTLPRCKDIGWYDNAHLHELMRKADSIWLASSWSKWEAKLINKSVENLIAEYGNKVVVFGAKHFGRIDLRDILASLSRGVEGYRNSPAEKVVMINDLMKKGLEGKAYVDLLEILCDEGLQCSVLDDSNKLLSSDGVHLTQAGASHLGGLLRRHPILNDFL